MLYPQNPTRYGTIIKFLLFRFFLALTARAPLRVLHGLAGPLGRLLLLIPNRAAKTTVLNLQTCFPELEPRVIRDLARTSMRNSLCSLFEMGRAWLWPMPKMIEMIRESKGVEAFRQAVSEGKGTILLAPHLGNWEIFGISMCYELPARFMYLPPRRPALDRLLRQSRARGGLRLAAAGKTGVSKLLRTLNSGELIGILPDQVPADRSGVFAPFFGQDAYTMTLACKLAQRPDVRVFCGYAARLPEGAGFRVDMQEFDLRRDSLDESVAAMNRAIEGMVRECPEQYQWEYKRFRRQPDGSEFYRA